MNVIDSSCWLEYLAESKIGIEIASVIENSFTVLVPSIVIYEVYKKLLALKGKEYAEQVIDYMNDCSVVMLDNELSVFAAEVGTKYKLAMADSIIYATALRNNAKLWTCDAHFKDLYNVEYFSKIKNI